MKRIVVASAAVLVMLCVSWAIAQAPQDKGHTGSIKIILEGFKNDKGQAVIGLGNSKENYLKEGKEFRHVVTPIKDKKAEYVFKDVPYGEYAFIAFHDENKDGKLDMNMIGMPTEAFGFSNNARGTLAPADWKAAKFALDKPNVTVTVKVFE